MRQYIVDAFANKPFSGNPAAVCILESFPNDKIMENIAEENQLSETAFLVQNGEKRQLRWFTPTGETDFCGHATLEGDRVKISGNAFLFGIEEIIAEF